MTKHHLRVLVPGIFAATALALATSVGAQTPAPPGPTPAATMSGHHKASATKAQHADMKKDCEAMMAKMQEQKDRLRAMDTTLDKLVAEMNAAKESKEVGAMEKPMAAVINELVAQRKALMPIMMEMQPAMMVHMTHHMHGTKGAMECPMMKNQAEPKADDTKPKM